MSAFQLARMVVNETAIPPRFRGDRRKYFVAVHGDIVTQEGYRHMVRANNALRLIEKLIGEEVSHV